MLFSCLDGHGRILKGDLLHPIRVMGMDPNACFWPRSSETGAIRPFEFHSRIRSRLPPESGEPALWHLETDPYQRVRRRDFPEETCLLAQEFQCIGLCRLCMNAFPERWIIKLPRCLPAEKFPTSGGCPGNQHLTDTQRCQNRGPVRLLVSLLEFNQEEKHHEQTN